MATLKYWEDWYKAKILKEDEGGAGGVGVDDDRGIKESEAKGAASSKDASANYDDDNEDDNDEVFEWLTGTGVDGGALWRRLMSLPRDARVLELGCGVSLIAERMAAEEGFNVHAVDFSHIPIDIMRRRASERHIPPERLRYDVADVLNLEDTFSAHSFDVVVDKGLLDVLLNAYDQVEWWRRCRSVRAGGSNKAEEEESQKVTRGGGARTAGGTTCGYDGEASKADALRALSQVSRVLRPGGVLIVLSYEPPRGRNEFLTDDRFGWRFQKQPEEDEKGNFLYVLAKEQSTPQPPDKDKDKVKDTAVVREEEEEEGGGGGGRGAIEENVTIYDPDELD